MRPSHWGHNGPFESLAWLKKPQVGVRVRVRRLGLVRVRVRVGVGVKFRNLKFIDQDDAAR